MTNPFSMLGPLAGEGNTIMHDESKIVDIIRDRQLAMRREMDRRGIAMKVVSQDSGIGYSTLLTYFPADPMARPAQIPGSAIYALAGHIPPDILSLLLPVGHVIVKAPEAINHDEIAEAMHDFLQAKERAHHPDSEAGREIGPGEDNVLRGKFTVVQGKAA
jgi:hypothetical protein